MRCFAAKTTLFATLILIVCLPCFGASLKVTITAPLYSIEKSASGDLIKVADFGGTSTPGHPMLPAKTFCIAIPPNAVVTDVRLSFPKEVELDDLYDIPAAGIPLTTGMTEEEINRLLDLKAQNYADTYYKDDPYPQAAARYAREAKFRRYRYVRVRYWPFTHLPASRRLVHRPQLDVEIEYNLRDFTDADAKSLYDTIGDVEARSFLVNYWDALGWYDEAKGTLRPPDDPVPTQGYSYVIICPPIDGQHVYTPLPEVDDTSPNYNFVDWKEDLGHSVKTVTTAWIYENYPNAYEYDYDDDGEPNFDEPMAIKAFLADKASPWGIRYVLLVGQNWGYEQTTEHTERPYFWWPDGSDDILLNALPTRVCTPLVGFQPGMPSDTYFADLYSDWDLNHNQKWCEWQAFDQGDITEDEPSFAANVYVARIPYAKEIDPETEETILKRILAKVMTFEPAEQEPSDRAWRSNALYLGPLMKLGGFGNYWWFHWPEVYGHAANGFDWYISHYTPGDQGWVYCRLYEAADAEHQYERDWDLTYGNTLEHWVGDPNDPDSHYAIVNAGGHGGLPPKKWTPE